MPHNPKISIVVPSFNQARFIVHTIQSIHVQGYDNVELIIIDGGSTDGTADVLRRNENRITYWHSNEDNGQTDALNQGIEKATGDIIGWINSDDLYIPGAFSTVIGEFARHPMTDVVFGDIIIINEQGQFIRECRHGKFSLESLCTLGLDVRQQALFWRRSQSAYVFPLDVNLRFCMDLQLVARLGLAGATFSHVPAFLGAYRHYPQTKTSQIWDVCISERHQIQTATRLAAFGNHNLKSKFLMRILRRFRMLTEGHFKYAMLGGRFGAGREARAAGERIMDICR